MPNRPEMDKGERVKGFCCSPLQKVTVIICKCAVNKDSILILETCTYFQVVQAVGEDWGDDATERL